MSRSSPADEPMSHHHSPADVPVTVLFGGPSAEHDVSIVSGTAIADALAALGHPVEQVVIDLAGDWWWLPHGHRRGDRPPVAYDDPAVLGATGPLPVGLALERLRATEPRPVVFVALHGPFGEDGTIQALLEAIGVPYTGSGVAASAIGMDKALFKRLCRALGLPVVELREVSLARWRREPEAVRAELDAFAASLDDGRVIVKPARLGSSVGMSIARDDAERAAALELAFRYDDLALVERYVARRRELEVSVLGNDPARLEVYGPGEILSGHEFYDYEAKYRPGLSATSPRADVPDELRSTILAIAREAYRAIGAEGFARVDFIVEDGARPLLSEINTIPGFTPISLFPAIAAEGGYDFAATCERIVELALERE
ncbi:MAG TPA: D-alanine--D-alanine ligase family protein, partial [Candidatus Limnocylindrales bacterium]|nr:D-alanine--D-alanine ligase family protein [Candidatus Limnocylindrales bacterium]